MRLGKEFRVLKIFIGEGDFQQQDALAATRRKQGWKMCKTPLDVREQEIKDAIVVVNGATAGDCIASGVISALWGGAKRVIVPLQHIMGGYGGDTDGELGRARSLARRLKNAGVLEDTRLKVTSTMIWKQAKSDFEDFFGE